MWDDLSGNLSVGWKRYITVAVERKTRAALRQVKKEKYNWWITDCKSYYLGKV